MNKLSYKSISAKEQDIQHDWYVADAENQVLGRFSSNIARIIRGKHKAYYTPHIDCGDNVVVINADKIRLTGKKWTDKEYNTYSGYPGGQKITTPAKLFEKDPVKILDRAIKGMLPKNRLGRKLKSHLFIYVGKEHQHEAQQPKEIKF